MDFKKGYKRADFTTFLKTKFLGDKFEEVFEQLLPVRKTAFFADNGIYKIGTINGLDKEIAILEIKQKSKKDPRITLTKDTFKLMQDYSIRNAIIVFYVDDESPWRLSLLTTNFTEDFKKELSSPKRYSFLLGPGEKTKTPEQRLLKQISGYEDLVSRFSVEVVRSEFFETYLELYVRLYKSIVNAEGFVDVLKAQKVDIVSFTKNLLGKIVFLYFIQQKGWLGLGKKESEYGKGNRDFMRIMWDNFSNNNQSMSSEKTGYFYNDYLERLFFAGLNIDRRDSDDRFPNLQMKVPYLNGGLFKEDYEGRESYVTKIDNDIFSNVKIKGDEADGILDIFDRYNFTIDEDSLYDSDIAVDPEMLGRIFEKMISISSDNIDEVIALYDAKGKKAKIDFGKELNKKLGAFYTPREIVHYMTKESLMSYIMNNVPGDKEKNEKLIRNLFDLKEHFLLNREDLIKTGFDANILEELAQIIPDVDEAIKKVKILDPAVGSGAFPMGLLHEISSMRYYMYGVFNKIFGDTIAPYKNKEGKLSMYQIKREIILNNIYGVDIDPGAIDIARLRFWLSLVVDEETPEPLPNFEFKFVCANTLIPLETENKQQSLEGELNIDTIKKYMSKYYNAQSNKEKNEWKKNIENYLGIGKENLIGHELKSRRRMQLESYKPFNQNHTTLFFDASLMMGNGKFDIIIGNPPYIDSEMMVKKMPEERTLYSQIYKYAKGNWDIFVPFVEKGFMLLREGGNISFIIPNKLIGAKYSETIREDINKYFTVSEIRDYSNVNVFKEADVYPVTFLFRKQKNNNLTDIKVTVMKNELEVDYSNNIPSSLFYKDIFWDRYFIKDSTLLSIINKISLNDDLNSFVDNVTAAATVSEAYLIKEKLIDGILENGLKFINTGSIDPYINFRGYKDTTYIKGKYLHPTILPDDLNNINVNRLKQAKSSKLVIAGMSTRFEVYYDEGNYVAGKSTTIILDNDKSKLKYIIGILNSKLLSFWYSCFYRSLKMAGGYLNFNSNTIKTIPIKKIFPEAQQPLVEKVNQILVITQQPSYDPKNLPQEQLEIEKEIDYMVYKLYGLTKEEIEVVEGSVTKN